jgi:shikimate kinase
MLNRDQDAVRAVDDAKAAGLSLGGVIRVVVDGLPPGIGDYDPWDAKLDARLTSALIAIPSVKAVAVGQAQDLTGPWKSSLYGVIRGGGVVTGSDGGIQAGMTTGGPVEVFITFKPISGVRQGIDSWDLARHRPAQAPYVRSDVTALGPGVQVVEAQTMTTVADAVLRVLKGHDFDAIKKAWSGFKTRAFALLGHLGPVVLCGMPGSGKTTAGRLVAQALGKGFVDTDQQVEELTGLPIPLFVARNGWEAFRQIEDRVVDEVIEAGAGVVALGGGALRDRVINRIHEKGGVLVLLDPGEDELVARLKAMDHPLFAGVPETGLRTRVRQVWDQRKQLYLQADFKVSGVFTPEMTRDEILARLGRWRESTAG